MDVNLSVLSDEQILQSVQSIKAEATLDGDSVHWSNLNGCIRDIERAVLNSPQIQHLIRIEQLAIKVLEYTERAHRPPVREEIPMGLINSAVKPRL